MRETTNFKMTIAEGSDYVNPLTQIFPNFVTIDETMFKNQTGRLFNYNVQKTGNTFTVEVTNKTSQFFRFLAPADFEEGDKINLGAKEITAVDQSGRPLTAKAFVGGANVICFLSSTDVCCPNITLDTANLLVVLTNSGTGGGGGGGTAEIAEDSKKLGGQLPAYYATASALSTLTDDVQVLENDQQSNETRLNALETSDETHEQKIQALEGKVTALESNTPPKIAIVDALPPEQDPATLYFVKVN